ncbi:DUF803-domain-containing protein, partial [Coniochaeta ligniaria NRRL 30616]
PDHDPHKDIKNWSSLIGIITAIVGNVLIALALNVQRYAHIRLHRQRNYHRLRAKKALKNAANGSNGGGPYGSIGSTNGSSESVARRDIGQGQGHNGEEEFYEDDPLAQSFESGGSGEDDDDSKKEVSTTYLKDPYWWLGQVLITVGECGNFLAYGFAPASIVSPLGVVALISNCVIAPMLFKEIFRTRDFWGVIIAIAGAVTVVLSANTQETKLEPHDVWKAISTMEFEIYVAVTCSLIAVLMWASPRYGNRTILIDLGLVGLFGGYTALSTKGVSSMLSSTFLGAFTTPVTYVLVLVLLGTAIMQVRYVNRALQRFDSTQVIPIQFVMFTLCVIIGSAVLYRDFERTTARQAAKFVGGCLLTFFGVFLITTGRPRHDEDEEVLSDEEGVEDTIHLTEQERAAAQQTTTTHPPSRRGSESARSRRSSKASRVNFSDAIIKQLTPVAESGVPSLRIPAAANNKHSPGVEEEEEVEQSPLLSNPWREGNADGNNNHPQHKRLETPAISSDSVPTISSSAVSDTLGPPPGTLHNHSHLYQASSHPDHPQDSPRPSTTGSRPHSHVFGAPFLSPSPFSSTVSGALADKLLPHLHTETPLSRRVGSRRSRPGLRNSLFVSQEDLDDQAEGERGAQSDREIASAVEPSRRSSHYEDGTEPDEDQDQSKSFRGRARSLSNTLGGLFGVRRKSKSSPEFEAGEDERE